jgi:hypothetical protein
MMIRCLTALALAILPAALAPAAKWVDGCPKVKAHMWRVGTSLGGGAPYAGSRLFEHVGHELTFSLRETDVARYGGFSTDPDGNTLEVTFTPILGDPIALPPVSATASSPSTLTVVVPDSRPILGRLLVGPARMVVKRGSQPMFVADRQVILPPMNDVRELVNDGYEVEVLGALDKGARLWIPLSFHGFGVGESPPECPTVLTPVTAFAVEFSLKKGDDQAFPYISFGNLKKNRLFFGDYLLFGDNLYGNKLLTRLDVSPEAQKSIIMCTRNDALELIVMVGLQNPALGDKSELLPIVSQGSPVNVKIEDISLDPDMAAILQSVTQDSARLPCYPAP